MTIRVVQIIASKQAYDQLCKVITEFKMIDSWQISDFNQQDVIFSIPLALETSQTFLDTVQSEISKNALKKIIISTAEAILPEESFYAPPKPNRFRITNPSQEVPRQELYHQVSTESILNVDFIILTLLSTIVAALGLLDDNLIAVIAAMVIAPMLMPNLASALSVVLGDMKLFMQSVRTNAAGIVTCFILSIVIGYLWPHDLRNAELLLQRTHVGFATVILALASGAAGALSLTSRLSSVLVGVMVAVALLPPLVAAGIFLGFAEYQKFLYAGILFFVNIVCVNLSAHLIFLLKGIHPQKWYEKQKAKTAIFWYLLFWMVSLLTLCIVIYFMKKIV